MPLCFVNLPNYITLTRIFSIPVLIWILSSSRFNSTNGERELLASFVFIAASLTDAIDGYLARKRAQVTTMGMLLDPVADKLLIAAAFITLVQFNPRIVPAWMAVIIIGREFLVSGLRSIAASEGFTIQASELGKSKMLVQIVSVVAAIIDHHWTHLPWYFLNLPVHPDRAGVDLGDGGSVAGLGHRLFRRLLEEDRPSRREAPQAAFLRAEPAQEAQRCPRSLSQRALCRFAGDLRILATERQLLLRLAHDSIESALEDRELDLTPPSPHLAEPRGAFTTLHLEGQLRGCIGYVFPTESLYKTVADTAQGGRL